MSRKEWGQGRVSEELLPKGDEHKQITEAKGWGTLFQVVWRTHINTQWTCYNWETKKISVVKYSMRLGEIIRTMGNPWKTLSRKLLKTKILERTL